MIWQVWRLAVYPTYTVYKNMVDTDTQGSRYNPCRYLHRTTLTLAYVIYHFQSIYICTGKAISWYTYTTLYGPDQFKLVKLGSSNLELNQLIVTSQKNDHIRRYYQELHQISDRGSIKPLIGILKLLISTTFFTT